MNKRMAQVKKYNHFAAGLKAAVWGECANAVKALRQQVMNAASS